MSKIIPLNSLVLTVGPTQSVNLSYVEKSFPKYEIIAVEDVREELFGDRNRKDLDSVVFSEIHRRVTTKLKLGERVVVVAPNLRKDSRISLADIGLSHGAPVFYILCYDTNGDEKTESRFKAVEYDALRGDSLAEVVDVRRQTFEAIRKTSIENPLEHISKRYRGITVIGDVHGMYQSLLTTLEWAKDRNHFVLSLGDIIDYGPGSLETADEVYRMVMRGSGKMLIGNHERKIARWIDQNDRGRSMMRLSDGNRVTTQALHKAGSVVRDRWCSRFRGLVNQSSLTFTLGDFTFAHAAIHPSVWSGEEIDARTLENFSLFGEYEPTTDGERPERTYNWITNIPKGKTVIVGHDTRSTSRPVIETNEQGGQAIFLDTGSGKGGTLSSVDLRFDREGNLDIESYRMN